jgi:CelD/BcsL family acetyltransferase involved in cellulose biosynthesis
VETASSPASQLSGPRPALLSLHDPRWARFVATHEGVLPYHHPAWSDVLSEAYGFRSFVFALVGPAGDVQAGVPLAEVRSPVRRRRWVALPFTDVMPPLLGTADASEFTHALERAGRDAGAASVEVRASVPHPRAHSRADAVTHTLGLGRDPNEVFATFHRSQVQRNVRRAVREGVTVRAAESEDDLARTFYALHVATRHRLGVPIQPRRFFKLLWRRLIDTGHGFVLLAEAQGGSPVAGAVFLTSPGTITYKFGASDSAAWGLRPNHLLFWTAIARACEAGYERFDFGRTDLEDEGLRAFKSGWGTVEEPLVYTTLAERQPTEARRRAAHAVRGILQRSPAIVCRAAGALLYRYAA